MSFKSFSEKSKAKRGLLTFAAKQGIELSAERVADLLHMQGDPMKWGFEEDDVNPVRAETVRESVGFAAAGIGTELQPLESAASDDTSESDDDGTDQVEGPVASPNMFAQLGATLGAVATAAPATATAAATQRAASRSSYTIEKDRPEQNGIKRPSAGGLCREVWDAMDAIRESTGEVPVSKQVRELAGARNWNDNNAMIEFYQWRKFNGITGRAKKVEAPVAA